MSIQISLSQLNHDDKKKILNDLHFRKKMNSKNRQQVFRVSGPEIICYKIRNDVLYLPFHYALKNIQNTKYPERTFFKFMSNIKFTGSLRPEQKNFKKQIIDVLNKSHSLLIALHVGFGKSIITLSIASSIQLKTIIIVHRIILLHQWIESIHNFCNHNIKIAEFGDENIDDCDILIINVLNVTKLSENILKQFGLVIVDECHLISTQFFSKSLQYLTPRYLIGLSATPYRNDGLDKIMDFYFGPDKIIKKLQLDHIVYKIQTSLEPPVEFNKNGQIDWNTILTYQSTHMGRNNMIKNIASHFQDRHILILCKRKDQVFHLYNELLSNNQSVTTLCGNQNHFDKNARILIATINKAGVGFSHEILDTLIVAADVEEYFIQYFGRITRRPDVKPIIFDIIDKNKILQQHFYTRKKLYQEIGGQILDFKKHFPMISVV